MTVVTVEVATKCPRWAQLASPRLPPRRPRRPRRTSEPHARTASRPSRPFPRFVQSRFANMHLVTLSAICAAALALPAAAAPLGFTTVIDAPPLAPSFTLGIEGFSEIPDLPLPTDDPTAAVPGSATQAKSKNFGRAYITAIPRNVRTADYGVSPDAAFDKAPSQPQADASVPVPVVATAAMAPPQPTSSQAIAARDFEAGDYMYDEAAKTPAKAKSPPAATDALSQPPSVPPKLPLPDSPISSKGNPDFSIVSKAAAVALQSVGGMRYSASDLAHGSAGQVFGSNHKATTTSSDDISPPPEFSATGQPPIEKRLIQPVSGVEAAPVQYASQGYPAEDVEEDPEQTETIEDAQEPLTPGGTYVKRHSLTFNTDSVFPNRPDPSANLSDPLVAQRMQQDKNVGLINIDSNSKPKAQSITNLTQEAQEAQQELAAEEAAEAASNPAPGSPEALKKAGPGTPPTMPKLHKLPSMPNAPTPTETATAI